MCPPRSSIDHARRPEEPAAAPLTGFRAEPPAESLRIHLGQQGPQSRVITVAGEIDVATAPDLKQAVRDVLGQETRRLIIDMDLVTFLDSTGLGVLVWAFQRMSARGGDLVLVCHNAACMRVMEITALSRVFTFASSVEDALAATD